IRCAAIARRTVARRRDASFRAGRECVRWADQRRRCRRGTAAREAAQERPMNAHDSLTALRDGSRATFLGGVAVAAVVAAAGAAVFSATFGWWPPRAALRVIVALLGGAYSLYLLARSDERTGRFVTFAAWGCGAAGLAAFAGTLGMYLIGHAT